MSIKFRRHLRGIALPHRKNTRDMETRRMPPPDIVTIPMIQHIGAECQPLVKAGDLVKVGQLIGTSGKKFSAPVHSSVSGKVKTVENFITTSGARTTAVVIETDHLQETDPSVAPPKVTNHREFVEAVNASGLVGLGGAGFPTHIKLDPQDLSKIDTLIVNIAECEPYITADFRACMEDGEGLASGIALLKKYLNLGRIIVGIEDNKQEAVRLLKGLLPADVEIQVLRSRYPQGAEKVLVYETTGRVVQEGKIPADVGVVVMNISSVIFIDRFLKTGMPLVEKRLTVDGSAIKTPQNLWAPIGASVRSVVEFCGGYSTEPGKLLMGGPMMGIALYTDDYPILKNNNAILALDRTEGRIPEETSCIRCGRCIDVCPVDLIPAALDRANRANDLERLKALRVNLCMECGCCSYVCPAKRHLVLANRMGKKKLRDAAAAGK